MEVKLVMELNEKQKEVYDFLLEFTKTNGYPPSVREICKAVSLKSTSTVHGHLKRLEKKGLIYRDPTKPRAIVINEISLNNNAINTLKIPIVGNITAGMPILATENIDGSFEISLNSIKHDNNLFALKVQGHSMINAGINDGDLAIIEQCNFADNGKIVVALINDEATLKTFYKEKNHIRLQPENNSMEPIIVKDCSILGVLVGIFRTF
ncbi:MAG: transcriptional repressor LexA [Sarcina ventriculi]|nr:transcriptional repressor LexA [Sarcina ventriculi]MDO4402351.1 transcriptional repressor LexA [Clostridiaceae bacterium]MBU5322127.1 transcriptional repressor LexA [Sarcina ventriculi]MCI5636363.1 transcriptional repressor LexA [Sarcina ventriculi]MDD7373967.1 transcriptional repressor LexA [Sarcina ventriculi]MDY7061755.1 transcriptional repressor LexA [Sarcina ventriculi]